MIRDLNSRPVAGNRRRRTSFLTIALAASAAIGAASPALATWTPDGVPVATEIHDQRRPVLVPDGAGGTIIVWWDDRGSALGIYAQRLNGDGNPMWGQNGTLVAGVTWTSVDPQAVSDGLGGVYVIWSDSRDLTHSEDHLYAQRIDANGTPYWPANGVKVCPNGGRQFFPAAVSDFRPQTGLNTPGVIVAWQDTRTGDFNVYAQRMDMDGNRLWGDAGVALSTGNTTVFPAITTDGTASPFFPAGAIVAWQTNGGDIRANWVDANGVVQWGANGLAVCTAARAQVQPSIVTVGPRRAIIAWEDQRNVVSDIYAQMVDNGMVSWFGDGVLVCDSDQTQTLPQVAAAADGAFVVWVDIRDPADYDIYGQRVDLNGFPQWATNGIPICGAFGPQYGVEITHDGTGGAFVAWIDSRAGEDTDLYVQRVTENGETQWQAEGICASCATGDQKTPEILFNNSFLFLAWEDTRDAFNGDDVYAGRLTAGGTVAVAGLAPASEFGIRMLSANPHHGLARFAVELPAAARVAAEIIDPLGRRVRELGGDILPAGHHELSWDWSDASRARLPHGVYFVRVHAGTRSNAIKLVHLR